MHLRKIVVFALASSLFLLLVGCRKASNRGRSIHYRTEDPKHEPNKDNPRKNRDSEHERRTRKLLTGSEVFKKYSGSVFMIFTSDGSNNYQGSGFFIGKHGLAVSNYHVFEGTNIGGEYIKLPYDDETLYKVSDVVYKSKEPDFIVFHVDYENSSYIPIAADKPNIGDKVFAIGSPRGLENTFSSGEVSQWRGQYLIQISALIDHGSSGGALFNEYGEAIGITSGSFYDGSQANLNYAWSIDAVKGHY